MLVAELDKWGIAHVLDREVHKQLEGKRTPSLAEENVQVFSRDLYMYIVILCDTLYMFAREDVRIQFEQLHRWGE